MNPKDDQNSNAKPMLNFVNVKYINVNVLVVLEFNMNTDY